MCGCLLGFIGTNMELAVLVVSSFHFGAFAQPQPPSAGRVDGETTRSLGPFHSRATLDGHSRSHPRLFWNAARATSMESSLGRAQCEESNGRS